jgi:hypothetical protein
VSQKGTQLFLSSSNCPQLMYGGSYGDDAQQVFAELCEFVEEAIETLEEAGKPLPQPLSLQELVAGKQVPSTGIRGSRSRPRKMVVSGRHSPQSTPVSAQAVALDGNPLKRRTGMAGEEVDGTHGLVGLSASAAARTHAGRVSRRGGYKFSLCS